MINGLDIFYTKVNKGSGLRIVENKSGSGCYMTKNNTNKSKKKLQTGSGLRMLK